MAVDKFPVEASHIMMFARSVADDNQIYYDADYAKSTEEGRVIAPPTFAQSSAQFDAEYFLRPQIGKEWFGSGKEATSIKKKESSGGGGGGGLHAEQHFEYHRHIGPATCSLRKLNPEKPGRRKENALANWSSVKRLLSIETKTEHWQLPREASAFAPSARSINRGNVWLFQQVI